MYGSQWLCSHTVLCSGLIKTGGKIQGSKIRKQWTSYMYCWDFFFNYHELSKAWYELSTAFINNHLPYFMRNNRVMASYSTRAHVRACGRAHVRASHPLFSPITFEFWYEYHIIWGYPTFILFNFLLLISTLQLCKLPRWKLY